MTPAVRKRTEKVYEVLVHLAIGATGYSAYGEIDTDMVQCDLAMRGNFGKFIQAVAGSFDQKGVIRDDKTHPFYLATWNYHYYEDLWQAAFWLVEHKITPKKL